MPPLRILCLFALALSAAALSAAESPREHLSLDAHWKFHLGDDWPRALDLSKAGASSGPAAESFDDDSWRVLNLPHDWAVELPFEKSADRNHGFKPIGPGFAANDIGWYRRTLELPKEDESKRIWLVFDGVFRNATVWVNGWLVSRHESGYYPFRADITDIVRFGAQNVVTVRVDATEPEGWFYEGAGIYRHVWLDKTAPVAVAPDGVFVRTEFAGNVPVGLPEIKADVAVINTLASAVNATVSCALITPAGKTLPPFANATQLEADSTRTISLKSVVPEPSLWSPESPSLYTLVTTISVDGKVVDRKETPFGIRTVAFDLEKGFLLNGRPYLIKGTCNHQDHAGVGVALPDALQSFRIARLKEMGSNAYRTSHNPPTPELLDGCDRLGMIVMDENRLLGSDADNLRKWEDQVRRDRNHPSVCIWSIANEEFSVQSTSQGANAARALQNRVKRLDPTRPVTYAAPQGNAFDGVNGVIDVRGWNYHVGGDMDKYHAAHPNQPNVGTEQASVVGTRGIYEDSPPRGYVRAYDDRGRDTAEAWWSYFADRPWLSGAFVWTGFDYRGEPTPFGWPCISSHFGILDTCGFPKDSYYYYKSWWGSDVVLHLVPHWNWQGREGQEIHVDALTNCREVELFLNGTSLGRKAVKPNSKPTWKVKYAAGVLSAKGFDATGQTIAETQVETTGQPVAVKLTRDLTGLSEAVKADGEDLAVFTVSAVDAQGRAVPTAQNKIVFNLDGPGRIIGVGNGDPSCHEPDVFLPPEPRTRPVVGWRWKVEAFPTKSDPSVRVLNAGLDESDWNEAKPGTNATIGNLPLYEGRTAVYRAHLRLTEEDLSAPALRLRFGGCNRNGWYFVNGQLVGESRKWEERPSFDVKRYLQAGDNIIAVGVRHGGTYGGLNPNVNLEIGAKPAVVQWSRSLFNGLAQIIVQSATTSGKLELTAAADGLKPATATLETRPSPLRPSVP